VPAKTYGFARAKVRQMQLEHLDGLRIAEEGEFPASEHAAIRRFVEAVRALSDDARPENVDRYLVASRALDDSRSRRTPRPSRAA
jgi:uncharacterized protein HemY